jgi:hypothetical protein
LFCPRIELRRGAFRFAADFRFARVVVRAARAVARFVFFGI